MLTAIAGTNAILTVKGQFIEKPTAFDVIEQSVFEAVSFFQILTVFVGINAILTVKGQFIEKPTAFDVIEQSVLEAVSIFRY